MIIDVEKGDYEKVDRQYWEKFLVFQEIETIIQVIQRHHQAYMKMKKRISHSPDVAVTTQKGTYVSGTDGIRIITSLKY